jgi:catalase
LCDKRRRNSPDEGPSGRVGQVPRIPLRCIRATRYWTQAGNLFRLMNAEEKARLIGNIAGAMQVVPRAIQLRQIRHFYKADPAYGEGVAKDLGIDVKDVKAA